MVDENKTEPTTPEGVATPPEQGATTPDVDTKKTEPAPTALDGAKADVPKPKEETKAEEPKTEEPKAPWGDGWREALSGEDEKVKKLLSRYASPNEFLKAHLELQKKLSSGEAKKTLDKDATPEQIAEYRKANGIPETADKYLDTLPKGTVLGEKDAEAFKPFLEKMHAKNASPEFVHEAVMAYQEAQEQAMAKLYDSDIQAKESTEDTLRAEWGQDYRANINHVNNLLDGSFPPTVIDALKRGRLGDENNTPLFSSPEVLKAFAQIARELNPTGKAMPGIGMDNLASIEDQIKHFETVEMRKAGWHNDTKANKTYQSLLEARMRYSK